MVVKNDVQLSHLGQLLAQSLERIDAYEARIATNRQRDTIHINTVGSKLTAAYEQLRNASEYSEENLLRQRAIRRFFVRTLSFHEKVTTKPLAEELLTELTQAEYLPNNYLTHHELKELSNHIKRYYTAYWKYNKIELDDKKRQKLKDWLLDVLSIRCEQILQSNIRQLSFTQFAFTYLQPQFDIARIAQPEEVIDPHDYPIILYIAVQKALLKLDHSAIRTNLLDSYRQDITFLHNFESFNEKLDFLFNTKTVALATRTVSRNGATLRILYSGFYSKNHHLATSDLATPDKLAHAITAHTDHEYTLLSKMLDNGIIKSIIFLLITKSIIGLAIEVPYDLAVMNHIAWIPLLLNLFFPAIFIAASRMTLHTPSTLNTEAIAQQATNILFATQTPPHPVKIPKKVRSTGFNVVYLLMFGLAFAGLSYILYLLNFNIVQGIIFFIFLSTASFLAFRLSNQVRELEAISLSQGSLALLRDVLYMPFIYVGQQISFRYAKINIVATMLDLMIELPLKTVLRLLRQWTTFLSNKKDDLI